MGKGKKAKLKIPKQIAGVKIPKDLRKKAKAAVAFAESPMARELLAAGLTAAAAALAKAAESDKAAPAANAQAAERDPGAKPEQASKRDRFAAVAKDIARAAAAAYAEEARKKDKPNGGTADKLERAAH